MGAPLIGVGVAGNGISSYSGARVMLRIFSFYRQ